MCSIPSTISLTQVTLLYDRKSDLEAEFPPDSNFNCSMNLCYVGLSKLWQVFEKGLCFLKDSGDKTSYLCYALLVGDIRLAALGDQDIRSRKSSTLILLDCLALHCILSPLGSKAIRLHLPSLKVVAKGWTLLELRTRINKYTVQGQCNFRLYLMSKLHDTCKYEFVKTFSNH